MIARWEPLRPVPCAGPRPPAVTPRLGRAVPGRAGLIDWLVATLLVGALGGVGGCQQGIQWRLGTFDDAYQHAQRARRLSFVYFRSWYLVQCTDFEDHVLSDPAVRQATSDMVCIPLDFEWDQPLARRWDIGLVPAYVVLAPDGSVLARRQAPITREDLLESAEEARAKFSTATQPARASLFTLP